MAVKERERECRGGAGETVNEERGEGEMGEKTELVGIAKDDNISFKSRSNLQTLVCCGVDLRQLDIQIKIFFFFTLLSVQCAIRWWSFLTTSTFAEVK